MFELLVPAEQSQLSGVNGDHHAYEVEVRPRLMVQAIEELQDVRCGTGRVEDRRTRLSRGL